jgi:hypothetical protein
MGTWSSKGLNGDGMALTTHNQALRLKKAQSYTSTLPLGLLDILYSEFHLSPLLLDFLLGISISKTLYILSASGYYRDMEVINNTSVPHRTAAKSNKMF